MHTLPKAAPLSLLFLAGCWNSGGGGGVFREGCYLYQVSGRLVDAQHAPLAGYSLSISLSQFDPTTRPSGKIVVTAADGRFTQDVSTGLAWGGAGEPSPAPHLQSVNLAVEVQKDRWESLEVPVPDSPQSNPIDVGDIPLRR